MKLGYTIIYVPDVVQSLSFFERTFGLKQKYFDPSGDYAELDTGETTLSFVSHKLGKLSLPDGYVEASASARPLGVEIGLVTPKVKEFHAKALAEGATEIKKPEVKPWGQEVSFVRSPDGTLIEICSPPED